MENLTPAMRQYLEIKERNGDSILFFRMGDFYEMFFEDAKLASRVLGIALTSREKGKDIPMCGVPYHAASTYIAKLVKDGYKVAVCEQFEEPGKKGIIERKVTRIITPGVAFDAELLDPKANNFIAAACANERICGFAYMDATTGEFRATEVFGMESLIEEIRRIKPLELLIPQDSKECLKTPDPAVKKITALGKYDFDASVALNRLKSHFELAGLGGFGMDNFSEGIKAAGALLHYIKDTQKSDLLHVKKCSPYQTGDFLIIDPATRRNLEITQNMRSGDKSGTLLELLDRTRTAMGARLLRHWLLYPLKDILEIKKRQSAVEELFEERGIRSALQGLFDGVYDLERLIVRVTLGIANPRDLVSLKASLDKLPEIKKLLSTLSADLLAEADQMIDAAPQAARLIEESIVDTPPISVKDGGVIKDGFNKTLDELRDIGSGGKDWIARLEASERARTGINSLKIGYNRVFGYYIEVTRTNLSGVPQDYIRKQTLANAERFITPALKEWEEKILTAEEKAKAIEAEIFTKIREDVAKYSEKILSTAKALSVADALSSLSEAAHAMRAIKPEITLDDIIQIEGGRHPVVEAKTGDFISNELDLSPDTRVIILTGPNMAGKSTYLRQNAIIVLMAQIGAFVPATSAKIGIVDRIFTRVGASDDLSRGQSTFMVEMSETANILNNATGRSFIILDEIGRGTSTFDGLSIAWAIVEHIHDNPELKAKTLFATHYHELTELSLTKESVKNYNMAVKEWNGRVIFLRKVLPGGSSRSYGIQVARLAGIPDKVIERAKEILKNLETGELDSAGMPRIASRGASARQLSLLGGNDPLKEELEKIDINNITPLEALSKLNKLKGLLES